MAFKRHLKQLIDERDDEFPVEFREFKDIVRPFKPKSKTFKKAYEEYKNIFNNMPENTIVYQPTQLTNISGFRGKDKIKALQVIRPNLQHNTDIPSSFPLKKNKKEYQLHEVAPRGTYMIDIMIVRDLYYLVAINVNTRYLFVKLTNLEVSENEYSKDDRKSTVGYLNALRALMDKGMKVRYLKGDGEKAFNSDESQQFYDEHDIEFKPVERQIKGAYPDFMKYEQLAGKGTTPLHSSLGIIDRVIRTLRDMAYNMKIGLITPNVMEELVFQYNHAPHTSLSKYAGFPVSPQQAQNDHELEGYIVRRICQENYNIKNSPGFILQNETKVKVYNQTDGMMKRRSKIQPGVHTIKGFHKGLFEVEGRINGENKIQKLPRHRIAPIYE